MKFRAATMDDADFLLEIKNDPETRRFAVVTHDEIKKADHLKWLKKHLEEILIVEELDQRAGMFRISEDFEVSINLSPQFRGRGLGRKIMQFCPKGVWAKIVNGNVPSMRLFLGSGFHIIDYKENYYFLQK